MEEFRREAAKAITGTKTSKRYPPHLRQMAVRYARTEMTKGASLGTVARALGVTPPSLKCWLTTSAPTVVPVRVRAERAEPAPRAPNEGLVVVTPDGYRIAVGGVQDAVALVRGLR